MSIKDQIFLASQYLAPHHLVSRAMGVLADSRAPEIKNAMISRFVRRYQVDMSQALIEDPRAYASFNEFFTRALKPDARPLDDDPHTIVSPADGAISQLGPIQAGRIFQAKGIASACRPCWVVTTSAPLLSRAEISPPFTSRPRTIIASTCR
ncbi:phosphatidylserine decarboxylase family protein [Bordetella holmesii 70147]|nr:phosphatidylserine decarboxylase family protein [Bordetella holmesii 70147]